MIFPSPISDEEALQRLGEIEQMVRAPNPAAVARYGVGPGELQQRRDLILNGISDVSGLDDARAALEEGNRILAKEYLYNALFDFITPYFGEDDAGDVSPNELREVDPFGIFAEDPSQGLPATGVYREVVIKVIELWYHL
jgi:hypothetical protein